MNDISSIAAIISMIQLDEMDLDLPAVSELGLFVQPLSARALGL